MQRLVDELLERPERIATAGLILSEVLQGVRADADHSRIRQSLLALPRLPEPSVETYLRAADLYRAARRRGLTIRSTIDCVLAAQCMEAGAQILHVDRDFDHLAQVAPLEIHPASSLRTR